MLISYIKNIRFHISSIIPTSQIGSQSGHIRLGAAGQGFQLASIRGEFGGQLGFDWAEHCVVLASVGLQ